MSFVSTLRKLKNATAQNPKVMKKLILSLTVFSLAYFSLKAQVKIGNNPNSINATSILELESTTKGLLITRMTSSELNALVSPLLGQKVGIYHQQCNETKQVFVTNHYTRTNS